ncbi:MAG: inositol-3-phosphate synthase [Candidatus Acidiferrales bacterium]
MRRPVSVAPPKGKLGILTPGMGAVSTTFMAGVELVRRGHSIPVGSLTQMGTIRLGKRTDGRTPKIKDFIKLAKLEDLVFGGWDVFSDDAYQAALKAGVLDAKDLAKAEKFLKTIKPMKAVFDQNYVKNLHGTHIKKGKNKFDLAQQLRQDIRDFKKKNKCDRLVMVWCASTEVFLKPEAVHKNGAPNLTVDIPALEEFAKAKNVPVGGKDFKTGQTLIKTVLAPAFKARMLGLSGWFSTNILGNRDGEVLDDPGSFKTKEESKLGAVEHILQPELYPELYGKIYHKVRINYYPPRGDNKEGWDNIDIFGWLNYPMQIKVDFLCRDSILAAPIVLDLALFFDLASRAGMRGIQEWLSFYFKSPMCAKELYPEHDLFIQLMKLKNTLRWMVGEDLITHLGAEYYD